MAITGGKNGERRVRNRLGWTLLAAAVVFAVTPPLLRHTDNLTKPIVRVSRRPISADFRRFYNLTIPEKTPAYVVAAGHVRGREWFIVGFEDRRGRPCYSSRGYFFTTDGNCPMRFHTSPVVLVGGTGDAQGSFLEYGIAAPQVRTVVFLTDTGQSWSTPALPAGSSMFRFFAALDPRGGVGGIAERAWKGSDGVLHRAPEVPSVVPTLCTNAEPLLQGGPDALPMAGTTTFAHANAVASASTTALVERFGATDVRVERRDGQVWTPPRSAPKVIEAADALLRLYLPAASRCPASPQSFEGIPLSFAIGAAPPLPEPATVHPKSGAEPTDSGLPAG